MKKQDCHAGKGIFWTATCILALACIWQMQIVRQELPRLVEWYNSQGYGYTLEQIESLADSPQVGFYMQAVLPLKGDLSAPDDTAQITVRMADAEYFSWSGIELEAGQWPRTSSTKADTEAAVSYDWALSHYKHLNIIGQPVQINGHTFRISGVYRTKRSWRQKLSGDGTETVYLPFCSQYVSALFRLNYLYFQKNGKDFQCNQDYLKDIVAQASGVRTEPELVLDVESVSHVCLQNTVICALLWLLMAALYFGVSGKKAVGWICLLAWFATVMCFRWYIPLAYLPNGQIFAVGEYMQKYIRGQNLRHWYLETGYFGNLVYIHTWISWGIVTAVGGFTTLFVTRTAVKCLKKERRRTG